MVRKVGFLYFKKEEKILWQRNVKDLLMKN